MELVALFTAVIVTVASFWYCAVLVQEALAEIKVKKEEWRQRAKSKNTKELIYNPRTGIIERVRVNKEGQ